MQNINSVHIVILSMVKNSKETRKWRDGRRERYKPTSLRLVLLTAWITIMMNGEWHHYMHKWRISDAIEDTPKPKEKKTKKIRKKRKRKQRVWPLLPIIQTFALLQNFIWVSLENLLPKQIKEFLIRKHDIHPYAVSSQWLGYAGIFLGKYDNLTLRYHERRLRKQTHKQGELREISTFFVI